MDFYFNYFSRIGGESTLIVICHPIAARDAACGCTPWVYVMSLLVLETIY